MIQVFAVTVFIIFLLRKTREAYRNRKRMDDLTRDIPGPTPLPIIGSAHKFFNMTSEEIFAKIQEYIQFYRSPAKIWFGPDLGILVDNPEDLQTVFNSPDCLEKARIYKFFGTRKGLFTAPADLWKVHRKHLNPCFSPGVLKTFIPKFNEKARIMARSLEKLLNNGEFDVLPYTGTCTLDMTLATNLQTQTEVQNRFGRHLLGGIENLAEIINERIFSVLHHCPLLYRMSKLYWEERRARQVFSEVGDLVSLQEGYESGSYLAKLLSLRGMEFFDDEAIRDEIDTIIVGGNETTALTLSFVILILAMEPDVQEKMYQEMKSLDLDRDLDLESLSKLQYTEMVIKETLRLLPVGPVIGREATDDVQLASCVIPKGAQIIISSYSVHRDPRYWEKPHTFYPEHFLPENVAKRHPYAFIAFSGGPRNCIGIKYGWMSMKIILWHLLREYRFQTTLKWDALKLKMNVTLKLANKHMVSIERR